MRIPACRLFIFCLTFLFCLPADHYAQGTISFLAEAIQKEEQAAALGDEGNLAEATPLFQQVKAYYLQKGWYSAYLKTAIEEGMMYAWTGNRDQTILSFRNHLAKAPETDSLTAAYGNYYHKFGVAMYILDDYNYARTTFLKAIDYRSKVFDFPHVDLARSYHNLGVMEKYMGQYSQSKKNLLIALKHRQELNEPAQSATTYTELSDVSEIQGDYYNAIYYLNGATHLFEQAYGRIDEDVAGTYYSLGNYHESIGQYSRSKGHYLTAFTIFEQLGLKERMADCKAGLGIVEYNSGQANRAIALYQEAISMYQSLEEQPGYKLANTYNNLGLCFRQLKNLTAAFEAQNEALAIRKQLYPDRRHHDLVASFDNLANLYADQGNSDQALFFFRKALEQLIPGYDPSGSDLLPDYKALISSSNNPYLLEVLHDLGTTQLKSAQPKAQEAALSTFDFAVKVMEQMRKDQYGEGSKLYWLENSRPLFDQAIQVCHDLYAQTQEVEYIQKAWGFAKENKAVLLLESLNTTYEVQYSNLPDSLVTIYFQLKQRVADLEERLNTVRDPETLESIKSEWILLDEELNQFCVDHLNRKTTDQELPTQDLLNAVQASQPSDGALVEYFDGEEALTIFRIDASGIRMYRSPKSDQYDQSIEAFLRMVFKKPDRLSEAYQNYGTKAYQLYQALLAPVLEGGKLPANLLIAPDGMLSYLPFEVLLTQAPDQTGQDFLSLPYLLHATTCHYTYSPELWLENKEASSRLQSSKTVLGMASTYESDEFFLPLPGAVEEVVKLNEIYSNTNLSVGKEANLRTFLEIIDQEPWKAVHLAMHGVVDSLNDSYSRLIFTHVPPLDEGDQRELLAYEIAALDIQTPLVVLSACETGTGQLRRGEGVFSLARSFMSAGVPSVVMSLWSTNDQATKQIMGTFHEGLADGRSKSEALHAAKLAYLSNPADPIGHPSFWAPFVLIGDEVPLQGSGKQKFLIAALVMVCFLFLFTMGMLIARINHLKQQKKASSPNGNEA